MGWTMAARRSSSASSTPVGLEWWTICSKRCARQGCNKQPSYGVDDGSRTPDFCSQHARPKIRNKW